jgi:tubulin alpha
MVREVLTISVGQAGIQLGNRIWEQYLHEHQIQPNGQPWKEGLRKDDNGRQNDSQRTFFEETNAGCYVPRSIIVDLEASVIDDIKASKMSGLFQPDYLLGGKEDAANNFARGHYTVGKEMLDKVKDAVRQLTENSQNVQGYMMNHSVGGGTGSGHGMLILEHLAVEYRKKSKIGFEIYPSPNISTCIVEPYNALLSTHWLLDHTEVSLVLDNEAVYDICKAKLSVAEPSYAHLNRVITKVISSMTAALRFDGELNVDLNEFQTNLVPFPRLHFMTTALAPIVSAKKSGTANFDCKTITSDALQASNFLVKYTQFDSVEDKYMAISLNYRGDIKSKVSNATVQWIKSQEKVSFVEWCPTGFKIGLNSYPCTKLDDDDIAYANNNVVAIGNNIAVNRVFQERLVKKYDKMYSQRAYVHWFVGEGMEEGEFSEAREDLGFLEKDYLDVVAEQPSDEEEEEEF